MCSVCGCGHGEVKIDGKEPRNHSHDHSHDHEGESEIGVYSHAPGLAQKRMVQIEQDILAKNNSYAAQNSNLFSKQGILALNLVSSPGSGKTSLLARTIRELGKKPVISVIEGDQQTANDAQRIRETGAKAVQVNTGKGCHLDAHMIGHALEELAPHDGGIVFIENVGNLVCPAGFDLGEAHKVVILSVTEGEDKPIKYPDMFHASDLMLLNKIDLLPHLEFEVERCIDYALRVNPAIKILKVSATSGEGMEQWYEWVRTAHKMVLSGHPTADIYSKTGGKE